MTAAVAMQSRQGWPLWRHRLRRIHQWIGLIACIPAAVLGLTGSTLVFEPELDRLLHPAWYATEAGTPQPPAKIATAAEAALPGRSPALLVMPSRAGDPARLRLTSSHHRTESGRADRAGAEMVYVDAVSLAVLGHRDADAGVLHTISMLHANLLTRDRSLRPAIGWLGVAMLTLGLSGLVLWWPRGGLWRRAFLVRRGVRGRVLMRELHGAAGIWGFAVFIIVAVSGIALAFPRSAAALLDDKASPVPAAAPIAGARPLGIDAIADRAVHAVEQGELRAIIWPARPDQPYRVTVGRPDETAGAPPVTVYVDPWRGTISAIRDPRQMSFGAAALTWQHQLHRGAGLGPMWRIAVLAVGFLPAIFAATGSAMWLYDRRARRARPGPHRSPVPPNTALTEE